MSSSPGLYSLVLRLLCVAKKELQEDVFGGGVSAKENHVLFES